ncbi:MAG: RDD family protein, partial [Planctomycetota bacterium]
WVNLNGGRAAGAMRRAGTLSGRLMPAGLTGDGDRAVVLFRNGSLMAVNAERQESTGLWRYEREVLPSLPIDGRAVAATVADGRVWVLIRGRAVEVKTTEVAASGADTDDEPKPSGEGGAQAEAEADDEAEQPAIRRRLDDPRVRRAIGLPVRPGTMPVGDASSEPGETDGEAGSADVDEATPEPVANPSGGRDRLWVLKRGVWVEVGLPEDWSATMGEAALGAAGDTTSGVWLLGEVTDRQWGAWRGEVSVEPGDAASRAVAVSWSGGGEAMRGEAVAATRVGRQPVALAQRGEELVAWALRPSGLTRLGTLPIGVDPSEAWGAVGGADAAWAVVGPIEDGASGQSPAELGSRETYGLRAGGLTLDGRRTQTGPVELVTQPLLPGSPGMLIEAGVLIASISMIVWYWRRDAEQRTPRLPEGMAIGSLTQRLGALVIDVVPVYGLGCLVWRMSPAELMTHWPGSSNTSPDWWGLLPGASVIVGVIAHTTIAEAMGGRSLGKRLMGLKVVALDGSTPRRGQMITRGLLRCMELIAWLLALVPVLGPYRQRLGDLVAGTVVVVDAPYTDVEPPSDDDPDNDDDDDRGTRVDRRA